MPGPTSFSQSGARGARRIAPISVLPARTLGSPTAGIGTELLAHREKIQMTRPGSQFERSPVPIDRAIAATHAQFAHFRGECHEPDTRWRTGRDSNPRIWTQPRSQAARSIKVKPVAFVYTASVRSSVICSGP